MLTFLIEAVACFLLTGAKSNHIEMKKGLKGPFSMEEYTLPFYFHPEITRTFLLKSPDDLEVKHYQDGGGGGN